MSDAADHPRTGGVARGWGTKAFGLPAHIVLDRNAISLAEGVRAALSVAVIVFVAGVADRPPLMASALAAWLTCLCDAGGPIRRRVPALLAFAFVGAVLTAGCGLLRGAPVWIVVPIASAIVFGLSFARVWGQHGLQIGNLLSVAVVLALRQPLESVAEAAEAGALFLAGSLWATVLTMLIWRLYPHRPARRAVAACFVALARMVGDLRRLAASPDSDSATWERHLRAHRRGVREAIEAARTEVMTVVRARGPVVGRAAEAWIRLETADQLFGTLIGLSDLLEADAGAEDRAAADPVLRRLRPILVLLADYIATKAPSRLDRLLRAVAVMEESPPAWSRLRPVVARVADRLRIAITLAAADAAIPSLSQDPALPWRDRVLNPVRANLDWNSAVLRHALRVCAASVAAFAITLGWPGDYEHWLTITLLLTMQPFFALTVTRALERIGGTVLGGVAAAAMALFATTPLRLSILLFPLTLVAVALRKVSFGLFIAGITPIVVLLSELARPAEGEVTLALMRALYTLLGGALAVAGSLVLWPSWEPGRLMRELRAAVAAHGRYARTELSAVLGEETPAAVERARRAAGLASNNLEASLQRALLEPRRGGRALEAAMTVDAALRRMAGRLSALQLDPGADHDKTVWHDWRDWLDSAAASLSKGETELPPRPPVPVADRQADALVRLARQIELAAGAMKRAA